jgi:hypothetical protein
MCPLCVTNIALLVASATSSGGLAAAVALNRFFWRKEQSHQINKGENETGRETNESRDRVGI